MTKKGNDDELLDRVVQSEFYTGNPEISDCVSGVILRKSLSVQELSCGVFKFDLNVKNIVLFYYCSKHMIYMSNIK